jgi:adenosine kinase
VGHDFDLYSKWFTKQGIAHPYIHIIPEERTAHVTMFSDLDGNQISAVQSGAMNRAHLNSIHDAENVTFGVVAPDGTEGMILHAQEFKAAGIPFLFDPGKQFPAFTDIQITQMVHQATYIVVNDYEWEILHHATGMREADILKTIKALIITKGSEGALILTKNEKFEIPAAKPRDWLDPIGCGDAFRAGIVYGLEKGLDWQNTGRIATLMGAIKLEHVGTQNYTFTMDEFAHRFYQSFGFKIEL